MSRSSASEIESEEEYISTIEASKILKVTTPTVQRWIDSGAIPCYRTLGGHRRILRRDMDIFIQKMNDEGPKAARAVCVPDSGRVKILLVDDDPSILDVFKRMILSRFPDVLVQSTDSGLEALLMMIGQLVPDILILDMVMPKINDLDVIRRIRMESRFKSMKIIAISGHPDMEAESMAAGAAAFFPKGEDPLELIDSLPGHVPALRMA